MGKIIRAADMPGCPGCGTKTHGMQLHAYACPGCGKRLKCTIDAAGTPGIKLLNAEPERKVKGGQSGTLQAVPASY